MLHIAFFTLLVQNFISQQCCLFDITLPPCFLNLLFLAKKILWALQYIIFTKILVSFDQKYWALFTKILASFYQKIAKNWCLFTKILVSFYQKIAKKILGSFYQNIGGNQKYWWKKSPQPKKKKNVVGIQLKSLKSLWKILYIYVIEDGYNFSINI